MYECVCNIKSTFIYHTEVGYHQSQSEKLYSYPLAINFSSASGLKLNLLDIEFDWYYRIGGVGVGVGCYLGNIGT